MRRKRKGFRNKDPRYFEKLAVIKRGVHWFFNTESKKKLGVQNDIKRKNGKKVG
tara:strand:- start:8970 stop:9131 length:162 start_codon:yes stop_codon:yes gene_type:complete